MFSDTITITIDGVDKTLNRVDDSQKYSSEYLLVESDGELTLNIRNSRYTDKKRAGTEVQRHNVELIHKVVPTEVGLPATVRKAYFVFEKDFGDGNDGVNNAVGLAGWLLSANLTKMGNFES